MENLDVIINPRTFVPYWFEEKQLTVKGSLVLDRTNRPHELGTVFNAMWLDYKEQLREYKCTTYQTRTIKGGQNPQMVGFSEQDARKAFDEYLEGKRLEALEEVKRTIAHTGDGGEELQRFVAAVTGRTTELEVAIFQHLIWQIKRKMLGKKVKQHMMVILRGKQEGGKTEALRALFKPIKPWFKNASLKEVTDDRWKHFYKNAYAVFCDELQHAEWASVDALKNIITADEMDSRRLGTNTYDNIAQKATFLGASNKPLTELIRDSTGMRRFFEILTLDKMDWDTINHADSIKIWQSINENQEEPYIIPFLDKIREIQSELIVADPEEEFLRQFGLYEPKVADASSTFLSNSEIYSAYTRYCEQNGERKKTHILFSKKIKGYGLKRLECRSGHGGARGYMVPKMVKEWVGKYCMPYSPLRDLSENKPEEEK